MDFELFLNYLDNHKILYKPNFNPELIKNIEIVKNTGKTGKDFHVWSAEKEGNRFRLNFLLKNENHLTFQIFCKDCEKQIQSNLKLSEIFALKNNRA